MKRRGQWAKLGWCGAALVLGLCLCEVVVRVGGLAPLPRPKVEGGTMRDVDDPILRFENRPGATSTITYVDAYGWAPRRVLARVNAQGLRGPLVDQAPKPGVARIVCLGDSHTFGYGVGEGESWPAILERELAREPSAPRCEVLNTGVNAFDAEQEALYLERHAIHWRPSLVILQFHLNDTAMRGQELTESQRPGWLLSLVDPNAENWLAKLRVHSRFADLIADGIFRRRSLALYASARTEMYGPEHPAWVRVRAALTQARDVATVGGASFVVILFPFLLRTGEHLASHGAFEVVQGFCREAGIPCLDLEPAFAGLDVDRLRVHPQDYHATAEAHAIVGAAVARWLVDRGAVKR